MVSSAPGKIILFGEHAVVYGQPALAVPVTQVQAQVDINDVSGGGIHIEAPDIQLSTEFSRLPQDDPIAAAINNVFSTLGILPKESGSGDGLEIKINSTIPVASGLGSGAAVSVALIRALASHLGHSLEDEQVSAMAFEVEKLHHGTPSGIDNTVVTYARPVYFIKGRSNEIFQVKHPFTIVIGDTGIPSSTKVSVEDVKKLWEENTSHYEKLFAAIGSIVKTARQLIEVGMPESLGPLMDENHALLREMTVSSPELDHLVDVAREADALGAKMSGGGRGGNMIALVENKYAEKVAEALKDAGAVSTIITNVD